MKVASCFLPASIGNIQDRLYISLKKAGKLKDLGYVFIQNMYKDIDHLGIKKNA